MKTTIEISDTLFRQAKEHAAREGIPLREVVESGLWMSCIISRWPTVVSA